MNAHAFSLRESFSRDVIALTNLGLPAILGALESLLIAPVLKFGMTAGFGVAYRSGNTGIAIDYGYRQVEFFKANSVGSIRIDF